VRVEGYTLEFKYMFNLFSLLSIGLLNILGSIPT
jgi:hypothetical protein